MKQYRFKIDTPWGKKGEEAKAVWANDISYLKPELFPDLFEEIPDSVEKVAAKLADLWAQPNGGLFETWKAIAKATIAAGLDPDKLEIEGK